MTNDYVSIPVRSGRGGAADKAALLDAQATQWAQTEAIQLATLKIVRASGNDMRAAAARICAFVAKLPYRREEGEIFREPSKTLTLGGDCDDLALLCVAMMRAVGIPAKFVFAFNSAGAAYHVWIAFRSPASSTVWIDFDPVKTSEVQWMTGNTDPPAPAPLESGLAWPSLLLGAAVGWLIGRARQ